MATRGSAHPGWGRSRSCADGVCGGRGPGRPNLAGSKPRPGTPRCRTCAPTRQPGPPGSWSFRQSMSRPAWWAGPRRGGRMRIRLLYACARAVSAALERPSAAKLMVVRRPEVGAFHLESFPRCIRAVYVGRVTKSGNTLNRACGCRKSYHIGSHTATGMHVRAPRGAL